MTHRLVVFFGNCQARTLSKLYKDHIAPLRAEKVTWIDKVKTAKPDIHEADVLFEQIFNANDPGVSRDMQGSAVHIKFPHVSAMFLWPFSGHEHPRNHEDAKNPARPRGPYQPEIGDRFLNSLIKDNVPAEDAIKAYYDLDIVKRAKLERIFEIHMDQQRARDLASGIQVADRIQSRLRHEQLFTTRGHLTMPFFRDVAMAILPRAGADPDIVSQALSSLEASPYPDVEAPLHPAIIDHFGLTFASDATRYTFSPLGRLSRDEWWRRYLTYDWNRKLHDGLLAANHGKTDIALGLVAEGLSDSPASSAGWRCQCRLLMQLNRIDEAEAAARRAMELDEALPDGAAEYALVLLRQKQIVAAEETARAALERCPVHRRAHFALVSVLMAQGRFGEAISTLEALLRIAPGNAQAQQRLAALLDREGRREQTMSMLRRAVATRPEDAPALKEYTSRLLAGDNAADAEKLAREGFAANQDSSEFALVLGQVLFKTGKAEEAAQMLHQALQAGVEGPGMHGLLADILVRFRELDAAIQHAAQEVGLSEHVELPHVRLARLLLQAGRSADAEMSARRGLEILPDSARLKRLLGDALDRQKRYAEALKMFEDVANEGGGDANLRERIAHLRTRAA